MSDFSFDDSFDSASGSDEAEARVERELQPVVIGGSLPTYSSMFSGNLPFPPPPSTQKDPHIPARGSVKGMFEVEHSNDWK